MSNIILNVQKGNEKNTYFRKYKILEISLIN